MCTQFGPQAEHFLKKLYLRRKIYNSQIITFNNQAGRQILQIHIYEHLTDHFEEPIFQFLHEKKHLLSRTENAQCHE